MLFTLARELGMTVSELEARMSHRELVEWLALFRIEQRDRQEAELDRKLEARAANLGKYRR